jgi:hypothetical protein
MRFALVSQCQKVVQGPVILAFFHYNGTFAGRKINHIRVTGPSPVEWEKGEDYLLYLQLESITDAVVMAQLIKSKKLSEVYRA